MYAHETRRPLVGLAIAYALGLHMGYECHPSLIFALLGTLFCVCLAWHFRRGSAGVYLHLLLFFIAMLQVIGIMHYASPVSDTIEEMYSYEEQHVQIRGTVCLEPRFYPIRNNQHGRWSFQLSKLVMESNPQSLFDPQHVIRVSVFGWSNDLMPLRGEEVRGEGKWKASYFPSRASYNLYLSSLHQLHREEKTWNLSIKQRIDSWRRTALSILSADQNKYRDHAAIYKALVLGARNELPVSWRETFKRCGCMHIFSISGLHVGICTLLLTLLLKTAGVSLRWMGLYIIPLLLLFCWMTGLRASAIRATCMAMVYFIGLLFKRMPDMSNCVAVTALLMLLSQPLYVADVGFVYSFVIVAYILLGLSALPDKFRHKKGVLGYLLMLGFSSLIANSISIPLSLYYFSEATWLGLICNCVVIPLTFLIVLCGWVSLLLPPLASFYNQAAYYLIESVMLFLKYVSSWSDPWRLSDPPTYPSLLLWLVSIGMVLSFRKVSVLCVGGVIGGIIALLLFVI